MDANRYFYSAARSGRQRCARQLNGESTCIHKCDHLIVLIIGAVADVIAASVRIDDNAVDGQRGTTGPADFHPWSQLSRANSKSLSPREPDHRLCVDSPQMSPLSIGHDETPMRPVEAVSIDVIPDAHKSIRRGMNLVSKIPTNLKGVNGKLPARSFRRRRAQRMRPGSGFVEFVLGLPDQFHCRRTGSTNDLHGQLQVVTLRASASVFSVNWTSR